MKHFKILGLAVMAVLSFLVFFNLNSEPFAGDGLITPPLALGVLYISFSTLGATALRLGKSRHYSQYRLFTHRLSTPNTTNDNAACTVTIDPFVGELSELHEERHAPPHVSVMAC